MGCVCCSLSSFVSILLNAFERISLCTVCAMLTCCILFTILTVMILGIGIGFHYCTVQNSVDAMEKAAKAAGALRSGEEPLQSPMMRSVNKAVKRGFAHRLNKRDRADALMPSNNNTINDQILNGRNFSFTSYRIKRDLAGITEMPNVTYSNKTINNTILYYPGGNFTGTNNTISNLEHSDDDIRMFNLNNDMDQHNITKRKVDVNNAAGPVPSHNYTLFPTTLFVQNCSLLNLLTSFLV